MTSPWRRSPVWLLAFTFGVAGLTASAAPTDYRFETASPTVERGVGVPLRIEVRERSQNRLVPNVKFRDPRVDRTLDGLPTAILPAFFEPSLEFGVYRFRTDLPTDGNWTLNFTAVIPGESQPVGGSVTFKVVGPRARP
jgi:hypothetical protein